MKTEQIILNIQALQSTKHVKIYKMSLIGLSNKKIAEELNTNVGHVYNVLKNYREKEELRLKSDLVVC